MRPLVVLALVLPSLAVAQDIKVLQDATPDLPPGVVHFVSKDGTPLQIGIVRGTDVSQAGTMTIVEKLYDDLCTTPCALEMPVGWHELRVAYEDKEWIAKVEVVSGEQTYRLPRYKPGLVIGGIVLTSLTVTAPIGIPMWAAGWPDKPKRIAGPPAP